MNKNEALGRLHAAEATFLLEMGWVPLVDSEGFVFWGKAGEPPATQDTALIRAKGRIGERR